ncbi:MAG TPA: protein-glutamate O-methyltransferase CheR [Acidobacteriota bacterium]|nr:protein-glutamate O-methyltransferase CheR [Acidobacteriota bacterium]
MAPPQHRPARSSTVKGSVEERPLSGGVRASAHSLQLSPEQFKKLSRFVYRLTGIDLKSGKEELVKTRLNKRIGQLGLNSFDDYLQYVQQIGNEGELTSMLDALTTNKTSFFREEEHFRFLRQVILPCLQNRRTVRMWSAGCSSGEEPLSIAMLLREHFSDFEERDIRLLATDLSTQALARARRGCFAEQTVSTIPTAMLSRYFQREKAAFGDVFRASPAILDMVAFARLNLVSRWPMKGPFQVIFCRNVMIYFDKPARQRLVRRFAELLQAGGYLLIGHSESLTGLSHPYRFVQPAVYRKPASGGER